MSLAKTLWEENADLSRAALVHRFVRGLKEGSLPLNSFQRYIGQDAFFLEAFARAYALALAHSPDQEGLREFADLLSGLEDVSPGDATLAYTDFLLASAALGSVGETCAAMTPCMRLYAFLGQELAAEGVSEDNPYTEWIETYADPGFEALAAKLEDLLNRYASDAPAIRTTYRRAMTLELAFFEANVETA